MNSRNNLVVILHNPITPNARVDDADLLDEIAAVETALDTLGWSHERLVFDTDVVQVKRELERLNPVVVFNLVESFEGKGSHQYLAPALLEHWRYRYTGGSAEALFITTDKLLTKDLLSLNAIPTPPYFAPKRYEALTPGIRYIVKAVDEDASLGLDANSIITPLSTEDLLTLIAQKEREHGVRYFAEQFIEGREFNVTILGKNGEPEILPLAEIRFINFDDARPKIVDYRAKWVEHSFEYQNTQRSFVFPPEDAPILARIAEIAARCWRGLRLTGYARIDMRVDEKGSPWVLEVNANPCITPYGGVAAACAQASLSYSSFIERVLAEAIRER